MLYTQVEDAIELDSGRFPRPLRGRVDGDCVVLNGQIFAQFHTGRRGNTGRKGCRSYVSVSLFFRKAVI